MDIKVINSWESHYHSLFYYSLLFFVKGWSTCARLC